MTAGSPTPPSLLLAAGIAGFLPFNFPRARIFMGDVGSQFCGFMLAVLAVVASRFQGLEMSFLLVPMLLSGVLFDVGFTLVRRAVAGERLTAPHRGHLYQVAQRAGVPAPAVALIHWGFAVYGGLCCLVFIALPSQWKPLVPALTLLPQLAWLGFVVHARQASRDRSDGGKASARVARPLPRSPPGDGRGGAAERVSIFISLGISRACLLLGVQVAGLRMPRKWATDAFGDGRNHKGRRAMTGTWIDIGDGFRGYLAVPQCGSGPGLLLLQEIFGVNRTCATSPITTPRKATWCSRPTCSGGWSRASNWATATRTWRAPSRCMDVSIPTLATQDIATALACLRARPECTGKVGALGFCLGGLLAYLAAARCGVDCAVGYYGVGIEQHLDEAASIACPLVLHFGERDALVPAAARDAIAAALAGRRRRADLRLSRLRPRVQQSRPAELRQGGGADGALALDRRAAPGDGAALRSVGVVGAAYGVRIRRAGCRGDDAHDGGAALRQPHPGDDRRRRV